MHLRSKNSVIDIYLLSQSNSIIQVITNPTYMQSSCTVSIKQTYTVKKLKQSYPDDFQAVFVIIRGTIAEMSSKSIHNFLSIIPNRQTDTDFGENISSLMDLNIDNTEAYKCII